MRKHINETQKMYLVNFITNVVSKALVEKQTVDFLVMNDCTKICWQVRDERTEGNTKTIYIIDLVLIKKPSLVIWGKKEIPKEMFEFLTEWGKQANIEINFPQFN